MDPMSVRTGWRFPNSNLGSFPAWKLSGLKLLKDTALHARKPAGRLRREDRFLGHEDHRESADQQVAFERLVPLHANV